MKIEMTIKVEGESGTLSVVGETEVEEFNQLKHGELMNIMEVVINWFGTGNPNLIVKKEAENDS